MKPSLAEKKGGRQGRGNETKSTIIFAIEKTINDEGIKRAYARRIDNTSSEELSKYFINILTPRHILIRINGLDDSTRLFL